MLAAQLLGAAWFAVVFVHFLESDWILKLQEKAPKPFLCCTCMGFWAGLAVALPKAALIDALALAMCTSLLATWLERKTVILTK